MKLKISSAELKTPDSFKAKISTVAAELKVLERTPSEVGAQAPLHVEDVSNTLKSIWDLVTLWNIVIYYQKKKPKKKNSPAPSVA